METPYIGITCFAKGDPINQILSDFPRGHSHLLMIGVATSLNRLRGEHFDLPPGLRWCYPPVNEIAALFPDDPRTLNLVHYETYDFDTLFEQLVQITELGGRHMDGLQLNLCWPPPSAVRKYRAQHPEMKIVLQVGIAAFNQIDDSPEKLCNKLEEYLGIIDYLLLDPGEGLGYPIDTEKCRKYLQEITARGFEIGLGVAGGIGPESMHLVEPLVDEFPNLSIDTTAPVLDSDYRLDLEKARDYLFKSIEMFQREE